jgi:hypothetical protein
MENYLWEKGVAMKTLLENWNRFLAENRQNYHILSETAFSRIVTDYAESGYIVITSDRTCEAEKGSACSEEEDASQALVNKDNLVLLKQDLRSSGFGYLPVLGGYKEKLKDPETGEDVIGDDGEPKMVDTDQPENSVIVMARGDHEELKALGQSLSGKYGQDSFFYKPPNSVSRGAYWIKPDGSIDMSFDDFTYNDVNQIFYTMMDRGPKHRLTAISEGRELFFRIRTSPKSTAEARERYGEEFITFVEN